MANRHTETQHLDINGNYDVFDSRNISNFDRQNTSINRSNSPYSPSPSYWTGCSILSYSAGFSGYGSGANSNSIGCCSSGSTITSSGIKWSP